MNKSLRKIELKDISTLSIMLKDFWSTQLYEASDQDILEDIGRMLSPKSFARLILYKDEVAGFIFAYDKYGYVNNIEYLFIKKEFRDKGLGSFAIKEAMKSILEKGNPRVQIEVSINNVKALKLYHKLGFKYIDTLSLSTSLPGKTKKIIFKDLEFLANPKEEFKE